MLDSLKTALGGLLAGFSSHPVLIGVLVVSGLVVIWLKWHLIARAQSKALRDVYSGWFTPGQHRAAGRVTIMKPVGLLSTGIWTGLFFGACTLVLGNKVVNSADTTAQDWLVFAASCAFLLIALILIAVSFTRITFDSGHISRSGLFGAAVTMPLHQLDRVAPIGKSLMGGTILHFEGGLRIRVIARMSGYSHLLRVLGQHDPSVRMFLTTDAEPD